MAVMGSGRPGSAGYIYRHGWIPVAGSGAVDKRSKAKQKAVPSAPPAGIEVTSQDGVTTRTGSDPTRGLPEMNVQSSSRDSGKITPEQSRQAVTDYAWGGGQYHEMNSALRRGDAMSENARALKQGLDAEFARAKPLTRPTTVHRMVSLDPELKRNMVETALRNGVWTEKGFVSTSRDPDVVEDFSLGSDDVQLEIQVPAGTKTVNVSDYIDASQAGHYDQQETLLPAGTRMRFSLVSPGGSGQPVVIRAQVEPPGGFSAPPKPRTAPAPARPAANIPAAAPSGTYSIGPGAVRGVQAGVIKEGGWVYPVVDGKVDRTKKYRNDVKAQEEANIQANTIGFKRQQQGR